MYQDLDALKEKVVVIISSDLAHTHEASGPYGYSPAAEPYDKACGHWASSLHPTYLLDIAAQYVDKVRLYMYYSVIFSKVCFITSWQYNI